MSWESSLAEWYGARMSWKSGMVEWTEDDRAYISVVFSWQRERAFSKCVWYKAQGFDVYIGGNAVSVDPSIYIDVAKLGSYPDAISKHNPNATFTSRGCVRKCPFCIVPKAEGDLIELDNWIVRPIICDNNILATSRKHFDDVVDKLKPLKEVDFNQGLDARLLTKHHVERLSELDLPLVRLAWDHIGMEQAFLRAWNLLIDGGFAKSKIRSYVLINFHDTPEDSLYRLQKIKDMGGLPYPMRYEPLNSTRRNGHVSRHWNDPLLKAYMRYWARQIYLSPIPFDEYLETMLPDYRMKEIR